MTAIAEPQQKKSNTKSQESSADSKRKVWTKIFLYAASFFLPLIAINCVMYFQNRDCVPVLTTDNLREKERFYRTYSSKYDLVFVGDSRTYCGIHPDLIDKNLGSHSINMARFAHWFPTQYPYYQDLVKNIPAGTTVVWSIGHQNFVPATSIQPVYPIKLKNVPSYLIWGYSIESLADNLIHYDPLTQLIAARTKMREALNGFMQKPVEFNNAVAHVPNAGANPGAVAAPVNTLKAEEQKLEAEYRKDPSVYGVCFPEEDGKIASVVLMKYGGSYYRIERDPSFFRRKQAETHAKVLSKPLPANFVFEPSPEYWHTFKNTLELFKKNNIKLVVNEMEEAPHNYHNMQERAEYRRFMREQVEPCVRQLGFAYTRVDYSQFADDDYFDYNHFNSKGCDRYDKMLAEQLQPIIRRR